MIYSILSYCRTLSPVQPGSFMIYGEKQISKRFHDIQLAVEEKSCFDCVSGKGAVAPVPGC